MTRVWRAWNLTTILWPSWSVTRSVYSFIGALVHQPADIEDLYQQTCLVLWKKRDHFDPTRDFFPWACGIAKHEVFNWLRKRSTHGNVLLSEEALSDIAEEHIRAETEVDARRQFLDDCLGKLPEAQRAILRVCYEGDEPIKDIAASMKISATALSMRLYRIKTILQQCVESSMARSLS